jgi:hypothetical protein
MPISSEIGCKYMYQEEKWKLPSQRVKAKNTEDTEVLTAYLS